MTAKEALQKVKELFEEVAPPANEVPAVDPLEEYKEYTLADGTKVSMTALEVGGKVKDAVGEVELILDDNTKVKVLDGVITEIEAPAPPAEQPDPVDMSQFVSVEDFNVMKSEVTKLQELFAKLLTITEGMAGEPAAAPLEPNPVQSPKDARFRAIQEGLQFNKK